jgi:hypothetical protein
MNPIHILQPYFIRTHFNMILPSTPQSSKCLLSFRFSYRNVLYFSLLSHSSIHDIGPALLIILDFITLKVFKWYLYELQPITVVARTKACTDFARSNTGIAGSNPTRGMDVCVRLFCVCVVLRVGRGLRRADSPSKESYRLCID